MSSAARRGLGARRLHRARVVNGVGALTTALVLVVVLLTKFTHGAYIVVIAMPARLPADEGHPAALSHGRGRAAARTGRRDLAIARSHDRAGIAASRADVAGVGLRACHPTDDARGSDGADVRRGYHSPANNSGSSATSPSTWSCSTRRTATSPGRYWTTSRTSGAPAHVTSSPSSSPSTSWGTGGSTCCTTSPRCGSRRGCCSARCHGHQRPVAARVRRRQRPMNVSQSGSEQPTKWLRGADARSAMGGCAPSGSRASRLDRRYWQACGATSPSAACYCCTSSLSWPPLPSVDWFQDYSPRWARSCWPTSSSLRRSTPSSSRAGTP